LYSFLVRIRGQRQLKPTPAGFSTGPHNCLILRVRVLRDRLTQASTRH
jgi:hypothetical protein